MPMACGPQVQWVQHNGQIEGSRSTLMARLYGDQYIETEVKMTNKGFDPNIDLPVNMKVRCTRSTNDVADPICGQVYLRNVGNEEAVKFPRDKAIRDRCPKCGSIEWKHIARIESRTRMEVHPNGTKVPHHMHTVVGKG